MNRDCKYLLNFLSLSIIEVSSHSENRFHFLCILNLTSIKLSVLLIVSINIANYFFLIVEIGRDTVLINVILIAVPKAFEFPYF